MRNKGVGFLIIPIIAFFGIAFAFSLLGSEGIKDIKALTYNKYEKTLAKEESPYTIQDIQNSNAAYLLDPDFTITAENCQQVLADYFAAPSRLFFFIVRNEDFPGETNTEYKCDNITKNATFGEIFQDKALLPSDEGTITATSHPTKSKFTFHNNIGAIEIASRYEKTYITFFKFSFTGRDFCINEDLTDEFNTVFKENLRYSMIDWVAQ